MPVLKAALGAEGLAWAQPAADLLSTALVAALYLWTARRMMAPGQKMGPRPAPF